MALVDDAVPTLLLIAFSSSCRSWSYICLLSLLCWRASSCPCRCCSCGRTCCRCRVRMSTGSKEQGSDYMNIVCSWDHGRRILYIIRRKYSCTEMVALRKEGRPAPPHPCLAGLPETRGQRKAGALGELHHQAQRPQKCKGPACCNQRGRPAHAHVDRDRTPCLSCLARNLHIEQRRKVMRCEAARAQHA